MNTDFFYEDMHLFPVSDGFGFNRLEYCIRDTLNCEKMFSLLLSQSNPDDHMLPSTKFFEFLFALRSTSKVLDWCKLE